MLCSDIFACLERLIRPVILHHSSSERCRTWHRDCRASHRYIEQLPFLLEIEMDLGNKSDYRRVQIDRKPSCQPPPTLGKARNNSACNEAVLKRFPAALLQLALFCLAVLLMVKYCMLSLTSVLCYETENKNMKRR